MSRRRTSPEQDRLELAQGTVRLVPDPDRPSSWTLLVEGTPQSHVDLLDPTRLEFEYVRWLAHVVDLAGPPGRPLNVLHLGGGAWTLARYVAATRPGSRQRVVEIDAALAGFVRERLPSPGTGIRVRIGDAREVLTALGPASADVVVVDVFAGARIPAHLTTVEFVTEAARVLRPDGTYVANLADGAPLAFARGQVATASAVFGEVGLIGPPGVLRGRGFGNLALVAAPGRVPGERWERLTRATAADPFPARVVTGEALTRFAGGARPVRDAEAVASPLPPAGLMAL